MRSFKAVSSVIGAVMPVLYCGYLLFYFLDFSSSVEDIKANGLGPTLLGLGAVACMFGVLLIMKIFRLIASPPSPGGPDAPSDDGFDADAVIARYKARQSQEAAPVAPVRDVPRASAQRPSFGRKVR